MTDRPVMDDYLAAGIAEGFEQAIDEDQVIEAWQYLHDTRLAYKLQGWFGRRARMLLDEGVIQPTPPIILPTKKEVQP